LEYQQRRCRLDGAPAAPAHRRRSRLGGPAQAPKLSLLEEGEQLGLEVSSASNRPLALAVVGGLTSSTILSLFLVPVMFLIFARRVEAAAVAPELAPSHA
jgi:hypothetical protein